MPTTGASFPRLGSARAPPRKAPSVSETAADRGVVHTGGAISDTELQEGLARLGIVDDGVLGHGDPVGVT